MNETSTVVVWNAYGKTLHVFQNTTKTKALEAYVGMFNEQPNEAYVLEIDSKEPYFSVAT